MKIDMDHKLFEGFKDKGQVHQNLMVVAWLLFANLGLWCRFFTYSKLFIHLHSAFMSLTLLLTWISGFMIISKSGFTDMPTLHIVLGIAAMVLVLLVAGGGVMSQSLRTAPKTKPQLVKLMNKVHKIGGWFLLFVTWIQLLTSTKKGKFALILVINLLSFGIFLLLKYFLKKRAQQTALTSAQRSRQKDEQGRQLKQIKSSAQLAQYQRDYFIYEDRIYDVNNVLANHPGGWELIRAIKGREVDRYLYGTEPLEIFSQFESHRDQNIKMAGAPMAILYNPAPYRGMQDENICNLEQLAKQCKNGKMYTAYLSSKSKPFNYIGYNQLSQLGKYFTVKLGKNTTRLYSCVNFLCPVNMDFMGKVIGVGWQKNKIINYGGQVHQVVAKQPTEIAPFVPLFIKKYDKGKFTNKFLSGDFTSEIKISKPRGRGLALHEVAPGRILMLAAGTGLNPFCDLIDLMFKETLLFENHPQSARILQSNPVLQSRPLKSFEFVVFESVEQGSEIHPITLFQLNYLAQKNRVKAHIMSKFQNDHIFQAYPYLTRVRERFQSVIKQWVGPGGNAVQQVYICGPPKFNGSMAEELANIGVQPFKYKIL